MTARRPWVSVGGSTARRESGTGYATEQLRRLGVQPGGVLLVHTSFRATRPIEGGPLGLIEALRRALGPDGTLVMPSWPEDPDHPFDPLKTRPSRCLGAVPDLFWRLPGVRRSDHFHAFAAIGPQADEIVSGLLPLPPHVPESPVGRVHDLDGQVLLLGVGHDADTMLHLAEILAGVPYRVPKYGTILVGGRHARLDYLENDHCCARFTLADEWLRRRGFQSEGPVGHAHARLVRAQDIVAVALEHLASDPLLFLHPTSARCAECDEARGSLTSQTGQDEPSRDV